MTVFIALLRAVNVGAGTTLRMEELRASLSKLGLSSVRTLLQSGNVVFSSNLRDTASLESQLEARTARDLDVETTYFLRTAAEWTEVIARNPFPDEAITAPQRLVVTALRKAPSAQEWEALRHAIRGPEEVRRGGRHAYITYPAGIGPSRLTPAVIERHLGTKGTSRNWNTVTKLAALAHEVEELPRGPGHQG